MIYASRFARELSQELNIPESRAYRILWQAINHGADWGKKTSTRYIITDATAARQYVQGAVGHTPAPRTGKWVRIGSKGINLDEVASISMGKDFLVFETSSSIFQVLANRKDTQIFWQWFVEQTSPIPSEL